MQSKLHTASALMGAVATAVTLTAIGATSPVQAATLAPGSTLNLSQFNPGAGVSRNATQLNFFGPGIRIGTTNLTLGSQFNTASFPESLVNPQGSGAVTIGQSTGSFANYTLGAGLIKDLTLPAPTAAQRDDFLRFAATSIQLNPFSLPTWTGRFDLTSFTVASPTTYNFTGIFEVSGFDPTPGIGQLTFQDLSNPTSYSLSVSVPIPTPALLPGLLGLGVAALRNRKAEQSASADA